MENSLKSGTNSSFQQVQQAFCQWLRQPAQDLSTAVQGVAVDRMQVYRELLFNNVQNFIDMVFPVARSLVPREHWELLQQDFFTHAQCQSPFYMDISREFLDYLQQAEPAAIEDYPWLIELLHVEWMELHVELAESGWPDSLHLVSADILEQLDEATELALSVPVWVLGYRWPVYQWRVGQDVREAVENPGFILVWRDSEDDRCQLVLSPAYALIIDTMQQLNTFTRHSIRQHVSKQLAALDALAQQQLIEQVVTFLVQQQLLRIVPATVHPA